MPRYAAFIGLADGRYQALEDVVEADDPRGAANKVISLVAFHPEELFPEILVVPDDEVHVFTRDDAGRAATTDEDMPRLIEKGPRSVVIDAPEPDWTG